jgi:hypothetical protein
VDPADPRRRRKPPRTGSTPAPAALDAIGPYEVLQRIPSIDVTFGGADRTPLLDDRTATSHWAALDYLATFVAKPDPKTPPAVTIRSSSPPEASVLVRTSCRS